MNTARWAGVFVLGMIVGAAPGYLLSHREKHPVPAERTIEEVIDTGETAAGPHTLPVDLNGDGVDEQVSFGNKCDRRLTREVFDCKAGVYERVTITFSPAGKKWQVVKREPYTPEKK